MCYAQIAADFATDPVYADGWQAGDNGGTGFEPWNFDTDFEPPGGVEAQHRMDGLPAETQSEFNALGTAWTMVNTTGPPGGDVARAGRGFDALDVGQTLRLVVDNPTERRFFRGYFIRFNSRNGEPGGGSICYGGSACTPGTTPVPKLGITAFEYFTYGQWGIDSATPAEVPLFDTDTAEAGVQIDLTITGPDAYEVTIDPLGMAATFTQSGTLLNPGQPIDWLEFTFFNTATEAGFDTDFFIKSIEIIGDAPPGVPGDYNGNNSVDAADYVLWRDGGPLSNEVADPGTVSAADYAEWKARFGNTAGSGAGGVLSAAAVPEASTFVYLIAGFAGLIMLGTRSFATPKTAPAKCPLGHPRGQRD